MMSFTPSSNGSPILTPTKINTQFPQIRSSIRSSAVRRWVPLIAGVCLLLTFVQLGLVGGRSRGEQQQHVQSVQHIHINPPSTPPAGSSYQYGSGRASVAQPTALRRKDFPPKIWQTWKVDPLRFEERDLEKARSWTEKNPDWRYEVLTDGNDLRYVEYHYGPEGFNRPDIVAFYRDVTAAIIKADLLRYLVMYAEGGIYADIDVEAMRPMSKFIPERYDHADIDMVIGIEIDEPEWKDHPILGPKSRSFCQWTFMCKPQLPVMLRLVENIMGWLEGVAQNQTVPIGEIVLDFDAVISGTGPSAFTRAILQQMNEDRILSAVNDDAGGNSKQVSEITWDTFHDMDESKVVERVLVLNVEAFAAGQGHSDSGTHDTRHSLVRHHYHASNWPSRHPRYKHPAYGQVEDCNWNKDCVHKWDEDVAAFEKLNAEEQQRIIAEKEKEREEKEAEEERHREEEEARRREDEERHAKEDEERRAREEEERREEDERREQEGKKRVPLPAPSGFFSNAFGYIAFVVGFVVILKLNGCLSRKSANELPITEKL